MKILFLMIILFSTLVYAKPAILPVRVAKVKRAAIQETLSLTGMISALRMTELSSRVEALVSKVYVASGHRVKRGDKLVQLDNELAGYEVKRAAAVLEEAQAQLAESMRKRDELSHLIEQKYLPKTAYQTAISDVRIKNAVVKRNQAQYDRAQALFNQHLIKAPFAGVISNKQVEVGLWVQEGGQVLTLVDINYLRVETLVPQRYYSKLQVGMPVFITLDAMPNRDIKAKISYKIPVADSTAHNFPIHIEINNKAQEFTPGMTARVLFQLSTSGQPVLLVPRDAIIKKLNKPDSVWVLTPDADHYRVHLVTVKTGRVANGEIEIIDGELKPGMQVVVRGNETLQAQQQVSISSWPE